MAINERRAAAGDDVIAFGLIIMRNGARNCIRPVVVATHPQSGYSIDSARRRFATKFFGTKFIPSASNNFTSFTRLSDRTLQDL